MNAARAYRRLKEVEEQKLKNRVLLLKVELAKSKKKIEETRTRTDAIVKHRNEIMEKHARKVEEDARLEEERIKYMQLNAQARERMTTIRRANVLAVHYAKAEEAKEVQEMSKVNEILIEQQRALELKRASEVMELIRSQRLAGQEAREAELNRKREEARKEFQRRVEEEAARSSASEKQVQAMEAMEMELIQQLEQAQKAQIKAYQELEEALISSKRTIMETSREKLQASIVDSGAVKRTPKGGATQRKARSRKQSGAGEELNAPREAVAAT